VPRAKATAEPIELRVERTAELGMRRGLRVERSPALLFPVDTSVVAVAVGEAAAECIDRASFALVPAETPYEVRAKSSLTTLVTLLVGRGARESAHREYRPHVDARLFGELLATPRTLPRTRWFDEIVHRYVFERDVCAKHDSAAARFLETEIAKELYFLCAERSEMLRRASVVNESGDFVVRARGWIDENLFEPLRVADLARRIGTSESTLLRAFQRELGKAPAAYARERRLDAALLLLQTGRHTVSEVAARVGYASLAAFTSAFTRRFDRVPSSVRHADDAFEMLPPHGRPPGRPRSRRRKRGSL
jgi:AraC-like DNA-binding protein